MHKIFLAVGFLVVSSVAAPAQNAKELTTKKATSVAMVNLLNASADCKSGAVALPSLREKPANGSVQMAIAIVDLAATANCPARKTPAITLIYTPNSNFIGSDTVQIDVEAANRTTSLSYKILVGGDAL